MNDEEVEKTLVSRIDKYCAGCCVATILAFVISFILVFEFTPPLTFPPTPDQIVNRIIVPIVFWTLIIGIPLGIILEITLGRRIRSQVQSPAPVEKRPSTQKSHKGKLMHCPICDTSLQAEERFCPNCGAAITDTS
ncbi:MAG: hypothetical protein ACFE9D_12660 [Promethearchaeota archaeon]